MNAITKIAANAIREAELSAVRGALSDMGSRCGGCHRLESCGAAGIVRECAHYIGEGVSLTVIAGGAPEMDRQG